MKTSKTKLPILSRPFIFALLIFSMLGLANCSPQDPAVLTPDEKAKELSRRSRNSGQNNTSTGTATGVPPLADAATTVFLLDRQSEIIQFLALAGQLTEARERLVVQSCVRVTEVPRSATHLQVSLDFAQCFRKMSNQRLNQMGRITLDITLDENKKMSALKVSSADLSEESLTAYRMIMSKDKIRDRAEIRDQIQIEALRVSTEPLRFRLVEATTVTKATVNARSVQNYVIKTMTSGDIELLDVDGVLAAQHALISELDWKTEIVGAKSSPYFNLYLTPTAGTVNVESLELCGRRQGETRVKFAYRPDVSRDNDKVSYSSERVTLTSTKNPGRNVGIGVLACDAKTAGLGGWFVVDWGQLFLF
jgi:hypothetical protein